jgi:hypothetical protein
MKRHTLEDISQIKDPLQTYNFGLIIPNVPGGGDSYQLTLRAQTAIIPGVNIEPALVALRGLELVYAGRITYSHSIPFTYIEARDMKTRQALLRWFYLARDFRGSNPVGTYKETYSTTVDLELYDDTGKVIRTIRLFGVFPTALEDLGTDSQSTQVAAMTGTFSYDYFRDIEDK